jgi:hypothetical protein
MYVIELYKKADGWVLKRLNDLYLWALDWTGLYVGTLCFLMGAEQAAYMISRDMGWWTAFHLFFVLLISAPRYYWQSAGMHKLFNSISEQMEMTPIRHVFVFFVLTLIPLHVMKSNWWGVGDDIICILIWYVWCFRIRDREKKEFKILAPVTQGSR